MKHNILKSIFISLILVMGVGNAWAASEGSGWYDWASSENVYFDNTNSSYSNVSMLIGRQWNYGSDGVGSSGVNFTKIANTNNLYHAATTWNHYNTLLFINATGWGWEGKKVTERYSYASNYTNTNNVDINGTELFYAASSTKGATLNHEDLSSYTALNYDQKVQQELSTNNGSSYAASTAALATVKVSSYKLNSNNTTTSSSGTIASGSSNTTCSAARTATVTYTVSDVKTGYTFVGWYDGTTQKSTSTTYTYNATAAKTITARIKANQYTITYKDQGDVTFTGEHESGYPTEHTYGTATTLKTATKSGYDFGGWFTNSGCTGTAVTKLGATAYTSNITLYAKWTPKDYTITLNANGGASNGSATATYNSSTITNLTHPTRTDYRCNGYYTAASGGTLVLNIDGTLAKNVNGYTDANGNWTKDGNATLYAQWTYDVTEYTVTFGVGTGSTSYGSLSAYNNTTSASITSPAQVSSGQSVTFTAKPNTGYEVEGWYTNIACTEGKHDAGNTTYTTSITGETHVYVKFVEKTWEVTFAAGTGGTVTPSETRKVGQLTGITITATPKTGYSFVNWTSSNGGSFGSTTSASTTFKPTAATTVTANFSENKYTITVQSSNENFGTVSPENGSAGVTTELTIIATPKAGYRFVNWATETAGIIIADTNSDTTTITATSAGTVTANFEEIPLQTIYLKPTNDWKKDGAWFAVYYWNNESNGWASMIDGDGHGKLYTANIPEGYDNVIFVRLRPSTADGYKLDNSGLNWDNQWGQTADLVIPKDDKVLYDIESTNITHLYLTPHDNWKQADARFAAYFMDDNKSNYTWKSITDSIYSCEIPANMTYVIFCRMNPSALENKWDNKWNQTGDLTIPTNGQNCYSLTGGEWDGVTGKWSTIYDNSKWTTYDPEEIDLDQVVYLKPTNYWNQDSPTFVAHVWNNSSNEDISMTDAGSGYYTCTIPAGYHSIVFYRKSKDGKTIWNQTSDLSIPKHRANCYTIKSTGEGTTTKATGSWNEFMLIRDYHENQEINDMTGIVTVNSVISFSKATLTDNNRSELERALYWISFPYDVNLDNAFGFGKYGTNWIIEYYDGAERAEKGCWIEDTYWKYIEEPQDVTLEAGVGYVLALDLSTLTESVYNGAEQISLYFPTTDTANIANITSTTLLAHECTINRPTKEGDRRIKDSNWNILGVPSFANVHDFTTQVGDVNFYYQWDPTKDSYEAQPATTFQTMHAYMVQFAGTIDWQAKTVAPAAIAARRNAASRDQYTLRLVLQQAEQDQDQTFIRLLAEGATNEFDMNVDLSKIINHGANIYSLIGKEEAAANVLPIEESIIPIGLDIEKAGTYTFAMPDGTDGITAILIDYETQTEHNLLTTEYTVDLSEGTSNERFALRVVPNQVATNIESLFDGNCDQNVQKYIINGQLLIKNNGHIYDIQGRQVK